MYRTELGVGIVVDTSANAVYRRNVVVENKYRVFCTKQLPMRNVCFFLSQKIYVYYKKKY